MKTGKWQQIVRSGMVLGFLWAGSVVPVSGQAAVAPELTLEWLRALVAEAPFDLLDANPLTQPRLITEKVDDGRTWLEFAVDSLGAAAGGDPAAPAAANQWAQIDEAVSLLLKEADGLRLEAAKRAGTAAEANFNTARQKYLAGAARLLKFYGQAAGSLFDRTAGALDPANLPDWEMPGDLQLHDVAGAARLNPFTGGFSGRLSGDLELPAYETRLKVPNLSFDSRGNFDLTAFGTTRLPAGDARAITLTIPARRPLSLHFSDDGGFRAAGGVQLTLPDGIRLDAFFDVDDPRYEFGLGFSGGVTLKLARELALVRPVVNFTAADPPTVEAITGFAQFFGSLGKGMENFLTEVPELPDPAGFDVGRPPEFAVPETAVPFDAMGAWIAAVGNATVRPAVNGTLNATLQHARDILAGMRAEVAAVQTTLTPTLPQIQQLARIVELNAKARRALNAAQQTPLTNDAMMADATATVNDTVAKSGEWLRNLPDGVELKTGLAVLKVYVNAAANQQLSGGDNFDLELAGQRVVAFRGRLLLNFGFKADGTVNDAAKVSALSLSDLRVLTSSVLDLAALATSVGLVEDVTPVNRRILRTWFIRLHAEYDAAVLARDLEDRAILSLRLLDLMIASDSTGGALTDAEALFAATACVETSAFIAARGSAGTSGEKLAAAIMDAARKVLEVEQEAGNRRKLDLFGATPPPGFEEGGPGFAEQLFVQNVKDSMAILQGRGLLTAVVLSSYKNRLAAWLTASREAMAKNYPDTAAVERNLQEASGTLTSMAEMLAFISNLVPENLTLITEFKNPWQALHVNWLQVAEARKAHWYLAAYAQSLAEATTRYSTGAGTALTDSFRMAGSEAVTGLSRTVSALAGILETVGLEQFAFPLPGNLRIDRASGSFVFNRRNLNWNVGFGAKLAFPDTAFTLDVRQATLAKDGHFSLNLGTAGQVPLGGSSKLKYNLDTFTASGKTGDRFQFNGQGTLTYDGSAAVGDEFSVGLGAGFDSDTRIVSLHANLNNSPLRFGKDLVLLQGAAGLKFSTDHPQGALEVSGKLGLLARPQTVPPPPGNPTASDYWLTIDARPTTFVFSEQDVRAEFHSGRITLPPDLFTKSAPGAPPATFDIQGTLLVRYVFATGQVEFSGGQGAPFTLAISNLGIGLPGVRLGLPELPGFQLLITNAVLELSGTQFPLLKNLAASVTVPLPGNDAADPAQNRSGTFNLTAQNWRIDGLPQAASIGIGNDLRLGDFNGFKVDILSGSAFSLSGTPTVPRRFTIGLEGGIRAGFDERALTKSADGTAVFISGTGQFLWDLQHLPEVRNLALEVAGSFRLGKEGPAITGLAEGQLARVRVTNVENLFNHIAQPVIMTLEGAVDIPNAIKFGLVSSKFILDRNGLGFDPGGAVAQLRGQTLDLLKDTLPVYISKAGLLFGQPLQPGQPPPPPRPLIPATPGGPSLFDLDNIQFIVSGGLNFPLPPGLRTGTPGGPDAPAKPAIPGLSGAVEDLTVSLRKDPLTGLLFPQFNVDTLSLQIDNLDIPPLGGIKGGIAVVNLAELRQPQPDFSKITFVGQLGARFMGDTVGGGVLLAASPFQLHGICLDVNAGAAGLPLDGGVLGGILWTGGSGGIHFKNTFANPCEFSTYLQSPTPAFPPAGDPRLEAHALEDPIVEAGKPSGNMTDAEKRSSLYLKPEELSAPVGTFDPFDCLRDNWPPQSKNPLLVEIPENSGSEFFKGTQLSPAEADTLLNTIGLTAGDRRSAAELAADITGELLHRIAAPAKASVAALFGNPLPPDEPALFKHIISLTDRLLNSFDDAARPILIGVLEPVMGGRGSVRDAVKGLLLKGIPAFNVTYLGSGTFTHAAVAPVLDLKGTISASTTGAALARGELRLVGIPVAEASMGFSLTNKTGAISPFMGGLARVGLGPVQLGKLTMSAALPDAAAVFPHLQVFVESIGTTLSAAAQHHIQLLMENITGTPKPPGQTVQQFMLEQTEQHRYSLVAALFNYFALAAEDAANQGVRNYIPKLSADLRLGTADFDSLTLAFRTFVSATLNSLTPEICFGGKIQPSIFDIPMTLSGQAFASARMRFGPALRVPGLLPDGSPENHIDLLGNPTANLRPGAPPALREFSAYTQFSPTALILSPLMSVVPAAGLVAAVDSAEFGMSFQVEEWTPEKVGDFLTNPPKFYSDRTREFFETAVFSAGYSMSPFGMKLSDAQLRVCFPQQDLHPLNPEGSNQSRLHHPPMPAFTGERLVALPTPEELILAALNADRLKDATWRGKAGELDDLFPPPPAVPSTDGNMNFTNQVSADMRAKDATLELLKQKSFAKDYFPYGGIIGGGKLALPKLLTQGIPPEWTDLLAKSGDLATGFTQAKGQAWLTSFGAMGDFLASTESVGQLAFYLPAPNPVLLPGELEVNWSTMTVDSLMRRLKTDPAALIGRTVNPDFYPLDEIVFAGWTNAKLLGVDLAQAKISFANREFTATAQIQPNPATGTDNNWFNDFFSGSAQFSIKLPKDQETGLSNVGSSALFKQLASTIGEIRGLDAVTMKTRIDELQARLAGALPRISLELTAGVNLPPLVKNFMRPQASAGLKVFAFSPNYEPAYQPADQTGYAAARRQGGAGFCGNIRLGYFPVSEDFPGGQELFGVDLSQACLTILAPTPLSPLPSVIGDLAVPSFLLPGGFSFAGQAHFASSPLVNQDFLAITGAMSPITLGNFLKVTPLDAGQTQLGGTLRVTRTPGAPATGLSLKPAKVALPVLGGLNGTIYGEDQGGGKFTDFTFSGVPGQAWHAQVSLKGDLVIRDPFNPAADVVFRASNSGAAGFTGRIDGVGLDSFTIEIQIRNKMDIELFPGKAHGSKFTTNATDSVSCLYVKSDGTIYYDSGTRVIPLGSTDPTKSFASLNGRVEFGYNPAAPAPTITYGTVSTFSAAVGGLAEQLLSVTASGGSARGSVIVDASPGTSDQWSVEPSRLIVGAGQTGSFRVRYHPSAPTPSTVSLTLTEVRRGASVDTVKTLTGIPLTAASVHLSGTTVSFGTVPLGRPAGKILRLSNLGNAPVTISIPTPAAPFTRASAASVPIAANGTADVVFTFNPDDNAAFNTTVTLTATNSTAFPATVITLTGNGIKSAQWQQVRHGDGSDALRGLAFRAGTGAKFQAVGDNGVFLTNGSSEFVWNRRTNAKGVNLPAIQLPTATLGWAAGEQGTVLKSTNGGSSWSLITDSSLDRGSWRAVTTIDSATGFVAFAGSLKGKTDGVVVRQTGAATFVLASLPAGITGLNGIAFSTTTNGVAVGDNGKILRSTNGGVNWSLVALPAGVLPTTALRGVTSVSATVLLIVGDAGTVLRSTDSGATWSKITVPVTSDLNAVAMQSVSGATSGIAVGRDGVILTTVSGILWTVENSGITENLTAAVMSTTPAVVSEAGDILMRRPAGIAPAASIQNNLNAAGFASMTKDQAGYGDLLVSNSGGGPMTAAASSSNPAFIITPSGSQTIPAGGSARFTVSYIAKGADDSNTITITTSDPALPASTISFPSIKSDTGVQLPIALLHGPALVDLGTLAQGAPAISAKLVLQNLGLANAGITRYSVRSETDDFTASGKASIPPGQSQDMEIGFTPNSAGRQRAIIEVLSNAWNGVLPLEVTANVVPVPEQVVLRSNLPGLPALVNGAAVTLPLVYRISETVDDLPNLLLKRGKAITVTAPLSSGTGSNLRVFNHWSEGNSNVLGFTGGATSRELTATYDRSQTPGAVPSTAPALAPSCLFSVPSDTPAGPWVKVSQARLTLPWLGDPATGTRFQVEGAAFFSLTRGDASLTSSGVLIKVPDTAATRATKLENWKVLEITPGSWRMAYLSNTPAGEGSFSLVSATPGLRVFEKSVIPPSAFSATVQSNLIGPLGNATLAFTTTDDLPLAPPHLALGGSSFSAQAGLFASQPVLTLSASTQLRALGNGTGGYHINRDYNFVFDPTLPAIAPLTVAEGTEFMNLGFLRLTGGPGGATVGPAVNATGFSLRASNWDLRFFNSPDPINVETSLDSSGRFSLSGSFPASLAPFSGSPFLLKPGTDLAISATFDPLQEHVTCHWPTLTLNSKSSSGSAAWETAKIQFPPVDFDSSNFTLRCPLPTFNFSNGFAIGSRADRDADNYIALAFTSSSASFRLRERQNFSFLGTLRRDFDISTNGTLSGALHGRLGLTGPAPLDAAQEQISFEFTTANPSFVVNRSLFLTGARFELGRTGFFPSGRASVLIPDPTKPISQWGILSSVP